MLCNASHGMLFYFLRSHVLIYFHILWPPLFQLLWHAVRIFQKPLQTNRFGMILRGSHVLSKTSTKTNAFPIVWDYENNANSGTAGWTSGESEGELPIVKRRSGGGAAKNQWETQRFRKDAVGAYVGVAHACLSAPSSSPMAHLPSAHGAVPDIAER